jgi:hypothetical protein
VTDQELQQAKADLEECFRRRARRAGLEESLPVGRPMTEEETEDLQWQLGDFGPASGHGSRGKKRSKDVIDMTIEEMEAEIQETNEAIRKRRGKSLGLMLKPLWMLTAFACLVRSPVAAFTAYDCSNWSNVVESYSLLEPDACANMGRDGEVETTVYGEIVQIKQDRMIPVFRCTVIETLVAQYCGMFSAAGVTGYLKFRELKPLEAWECRKARKNGLLLINGRPISGKIGATVSHTMFLAGDLDDESNCEVGTVTLRDGKVLGGMASQGLYEITEGGVREDERVDRQSDAGLWGAGEGGRQEHCGQPRRDCGVGVRSHGVPADYPQAVQGDDEGLRQPDQHIRGVYGCR